MKSKKGSIIVFEGPDGVGKTHLAKSITALLKKDKIKARYFSFPGCIDGTLGNLIYQIHHHKSQLKEKLTPASLQILHLASHIDELEKRIKPSLDENINVILDRWWLSTLVYGKTLGVETAILEKIVNIEKHYWAGYEPKIVFILNNKPYRKTIKRWDVLNREYRCFCNNYIDEYDIKFISNVSCNMAEDIYQQIKQAIL